MRTFYAYKEYNNIIGVNNKEEVELILLLYEGHEPRQSLPMYANGVRSSVSSYYRRRIRIDDHCDGYIAHFLRESVTALGILQAAPAPMIECPAGPSAIRWQRWERRRLQG